MGRKEDKALALQIILEYAQSNPKDPSEGYTSDEINNVLTSVGLGRTRQGINLLLRELHLPTARTGPTPKTVATEELQAAAGLNQSEIAERLGISVSTLHRHEKRLGLTRPKGAKRRKVDLDRAVTEGLLSGVPRDVLASRLGKSESRIASIASRLRREGTKLPRFPYTRRSKPQQ